MAKLKDEAKEYSPGLPTVAQLDSISVDVNLKDHKRTFTDDEGNEKTRKEKVVVRDGEKYRVPKSVLKQLKEHLKQNPELANFKVTKSGQGLNTDYTVIPLQGKSEKVKDK